MPTGTASNYFVHTLLRARDWQHRPQLDEVCQWWREGGRGVLSLVGMGGAGKTAIVERFLRLLPSGLPEDPDIPKDISLPSPSSVFVFSFYDAPRVEAFFEALNLWLEPLQSPPKKTVSVKQLPPKLEYASGLLVIDGLEKVQNWGANKGSLGMLTNSKISQLLIHISRGGFTNLSVLITSRLSTPFLTEQSSRYNPLILVERWDLKRKLRIYFHEHPGGKAVCSMSPDKSISNALTLRVWQLNERKLTRYWLSFEVRITYERLDYLSVSVSEVRLASGYFAPALTHYSQSKDENLRKAVGEYVESIVYGFIQDVGD